MPDLFPDMDQPREPKGMPPGAVFGLACAEPECSGQLVCRWSHKLQRWFYGCSVYPDCLGTLPADKAGAPHGKPRTKALQRARAAAHEAFDTLWKGGHCSRGTAYAWLRRVMVLKPNQAHMYKMNSNQCARVVQLVAEKGPGTKFWTSWYRPGKTRRGGRRGRR